MEYIKGNSYFCETSSKIKQFSYLDKNINCDILIVGGGINGAILNYFLSKIYDVVLVESYQIGRNCTSQATALLEYQLDDYAEELKKYMSESEIVNIYKMGLESIEKIENFINQFGNFCNFRKCPSFLYTDCIFGKKSIIDEYYFRINNGFKANLYNQDNNPFPFKIQLGLYNEDGGAELNPYLFTKQMIENARNQKSIYENTEVVTFNICDDETIEVKTKSGNIIKCKKLILATGFDFSLMKEKKLCERFISYSIVTKPIKNISWKHNALIQDDKSPYHYLRILPDNRIIFGGEDSIFKLKPINKKLAEKKYLKLEKKLKEMLEDFKDEIIVDYKFCGAFGSTPNNLGLIGKTENPNILYFLSAGANGIINAMAGAKLIQDILQSKPNPLEKLFSPLREN